MGYVAVKGGQDAIENANRLVEYFRWRGRTEPIEVEQARTQMRLAVDRAMGEGSLYAPEHAALALLQVEGDSFEAAEAQKEGFRDIVDLGTYHITLLGSGVNALKSWLPAHHAAAAAFIKSTVEAIALMKTDKAAAFAAMTKWYGINDPALLQPIYDQAIQLPSKPYPSAEGLKVVRSIYTWREMEIHPPDYFIDSSFVAALDKNGYIDSLYQKHP